MRRMSPRSCAVSPQGAVPGLVAVDMSTIAPSAARRIGAELAAAGVDFIDAPVSGGEVGAIAGTLSIMAGGSDAAFAKALQTGLRVRWARTSSMSARPVPAR